MSRFIEEMKTDTKAGVSYWTVVNGLIEYTYTGLDWKGLLVSRSIGGCLGTAISGISSQWRDYVYKKSYPGFERSGMKRYTMNAFKDLFSGYLFTPVSIPILSAGLYLTKGYVDQNDIEMGIVNYLIFSPLTVPLFGLYLNEFRKVYSLQTAEEKASGQSENVQEPKIKEKVDLDSYVTDLHHIIQW